MLKVGTVQMECIPGDWERNLEVAGDLLKRCREQGVKLAVLPELFNTGYLMAPHLAEVAKEAFVITKTEISCLSCCLEIFIVAGMPVPNEGNKPVNAILLFTPDGRTKTAGKLHLCRMGDDEADYLSPGTIPLLFDLEGTKVGALICYDIAFPEAARILALEGAQIILVPAAWNVSSRSYVYDMATRSRALENNVWLVTSNQTGGPANSAFMGRSRFVDPKGSILDEMQTNPGVLVREVDLDLGQKLLNKGKTYPFLADRVPNKYHRLCQQ